MKISGVSAGAIFLAVTAATSALAAPAKKPDMTFFVTSTGPGRGADLDGLDGADAHCAELAKAAGSKRTNWRAYLSTTAPGGEAGINARDRIGKGPWRNAKGVLIARNVNELHSGRDKINKQNALTEKGETISGRGDAVNMHDILTGADPAGMYSTAGSDTTCANWTSSEGGSAIVGHHDRIGLKDTRHMKSWNSSHGTRGCSQEALKSTGGAGLFYCFAAK